MDELVQATFDYGVLDEARRIRVQVKAESIKTRMKRTAEDIIVIGQDFLEVKQDLDHGQFKGWLRSEFDMSYDTAINFMQVARKFANRPEIKNGKFPFLPISVLYELAAPSTPDSVIAQVQSGEITPTLEAIKAAKEAQRQAEERAKKIEEEAQLALVLADDRVSEARSQLRLFEEQDQSRRSEITYLSMQLKELEQQVATQSAQVIEKPVIPPEITARLEKLQSDIKERTRERDNLAQVRAEQDKALHQYRAANETLREQERYELRIKQQLQQITDTFARAVAVLLAQFPSVFDAQVFDHTDWARLDHAIEVVQRFLAECERLRAQPATLIIDAG